MKTFSKIEALARKNLKKTTKLNEYIKQRDSYYTKERLFKEKCQEAVQELQNRKEQEKYRDKKHQESLEGWKD